LLPSLLTLQPLLLSRRWLAHMDEAWRSIIESWGSFSVFQNQTLCLRRPNHRFLAKNRVDALLLMMLIFLKQAGVLYL
jgi:hypothetical protein